jgi:hypothetical protein
MRIPNTKGLKPSANGSHRKKPGTPKLLPRDFADIIACLPDGCPVVGGQAVAWWATKYGIRGKGDEPITSGDIDFWGGREDLEQMARAMHCKPVFPGKHEMTVWVGAIQISVKGERTLAEFVHVIPGLDIPYPEKASVEQEFREQSVHKVIQVLTPVSLVLAKLHALWRFDQKQRNDELHLKVSLKSSHAFISELLAQEEVRLVLRDCERLITARESSKPFRRLEKQHRFSILEAIPIEKIKQAAIDRNQSADNRKRLANFIHFRWARLTRKKDLGAPIENPSSGESGTK